MTDTAPQEAPATLSEQRRAALAKGRAIAAANRAARAAAPPAPKAAPVERRSASTNSDLEGLTENDCPDACTAECCVITGRKRVQFKNESWDNKGEPIVTYTEGWATHCGHPIKAGIQSVHQMEPKIKAKYTSAKKILRQLALDRKEV